jgi:hypothetical protein
MPSDGLTVTCHSWEPKKKGRPHAVSRVLCVAKAYPFCKRCPNSRFVLHLRFQLGEQTVACPRWEEGPRVEKNMPTGYATVRREICLKKNTFEYCPSCPNSRADIPKMSDPGWYERMHR